MEDYITTESIADKYRGAGRRKSPKYTPGIVFDAAIRLVVNGETINGFANEYALRRKFYDKIKFPKSMAAGANLVRNKDALDMVCRILFACDDELCAAAITKITAESLAGHISREVLDTRSRVYKLADNEELTLMDFAIEDYIVDTFAINIAEILQYINEFLDIEIYTEVCCGMLLHMLPESLPEERRTAAKFIAAHIISKVAEGRKRSYDPDRLRRRDVLISSYRNGTSFYTECRKAAEALTGRGQVNLILASLPKADKRLDVIQSLWPMDFDFTSIAPASTTAFAPEAFPGSADADKKFITTDQFMHLMLVRLLCEEPEARHIGYENLIQRKLPVKTAKEIVNRAFLMAELIGIDVRKEPGSREKQLILTNIAQSCLRELLFLHAAELAAGGQAKDADRIKPKNKRYADKRYEEAQLENRRLRKKIKEIAERASADVASKESEKKARALASEKNRKIAQLEKEIAALKEERDDLIELIFTEEKEECVQEEELEEKARAALKSRRILVWGCRADFKRKFDGKYPELQLLDTSDHHIRSLPPAQLAAYDGVLIQTNCCSHGMYWSVMRDVKNAGKPYAQMQKQDNSEQAFARSLLKLCETIERRERGEKSDAAE